MSDVEQEIVEEVAVEETAGSISLEDALKTVLKNALIHDGLARGLRESTRALAKGTAEMCVLCDSVTEKNIIKLVEALCNEPEQKIPLIKVSDAEQLGQWAGLCQYDLEGAPRKTVNTSVVVVKNWGVDSEERGVLLDYFSQQ